MRALAFLVILMPVRLDGQDPESGRQRRDVTFAGAEYNYVYFHGDLDPWQIAALSLANRGARGTFIGRVNFASRFDHKGAQWELDAYPRLSEKVYAFLNIGYSGAAIFPEWRSGGELFVALPNAWETSAGYRQLRFDGVPITLVTGSLGKYVGNSWISARPYVRVKDDGVSASVGLTGRRYFADADNYLGARVSVGSSPPERGDPTEISRTNAWSAAVQGSRTLRPGVVTNWSAGVEHEELSATTTRKRVDLLVGLRFQL